MRIAFICKQIIHHYLLSTIVNFVSERRGLKQHQFRIQVKRPIVVHNESRAPIDGSSSKVFGALGISSIKCVKQVDPAILIKVGVYSNCSKSAKIS